MPSGSRTDTAVPGHFRPRLTLQTLTRGDGLLGLRAVPGSGPRSTQVTVAQAHWTYATAGDLHWDTQCGDSLASFRRPSRWSAQACINFFRTGRCSAWL